MESLWLFVCFVTVIAELNYEQTDLDDLEDNDIVRIKYVLHDTYLRDDGDGTISASATLANSDYFLWKISTNNYNRTFQNIASDKYLKTRTNQQSCYTGTISGLGEAAAWFKQTNKFKNVKNMACCSVESSNDSVIQWDTSCNNDSQIVVFEKRVDNVYFTVNVGMVALQLDADSAAMWCEAFGATLATITSEEDNDEVYDLCVSTGAGSCWIGLNDITTEGSPEWRDGTTYSYTRLELANDKEGCDCVWIRVLPRTQQDKNWQYMPCDLLRPFICIGETINIDTAKLFNILDMEIIF